VIGLTLSWLKTQTNLLFTRKGSPISCGATRIAGEEIKVKEERPKVTTSIQCLQAVQKGENEN